VAFRSHEIYISRKTSRRLRWITQIARQTDPGQPTITRDEIADRLLNEKIEQEYPNIVELEKEYNKSEIELIEKLGLSGTGTRDSTGQGQPL
jgi:hypothetical protein